jgi:precorrin isomerase
MIDYVRDAAEIYRRSVAAIRREVDLDALPAELRALALRLVHATAMPEIARDLAASSGAAKIGEAALKSGAPILVDAEMVAQGVIRADLPANNAVICTLNDAAVRDLAKKLGTTRSAAAVELWRERVAGAVVAIGNAPTALFHLLERLDQGWPAPALILGFPVGFVGAAESKAALAAQTRVPFIALKGRRGGSALAAAAVNALARPDGLG